MEKITLPPFEMAATQAGHIGFTETGPRAAQGGGKSPAASSPPSFGNTLLGALEYVNGKQLAESDVAKRLVTDPDSVDVHDVTIAMAEAGMSLEAANRIINQMITSWNEITTTR